MNEELYTLVCTNCCKTYVEVQIDEKFLLEEPFEVTCPTCGKKEYYEVTCPLCGRVEKHK